MQAHHHLATTPAIDLVRISLAGFFTPEALARFDADRRATYATFRPRKGYLTLIDISALNLQRQDLLPRFGAMMEDPGTRSRRLAFVTGDAAVKMQLRRMIVRDDIACFAEAGAAEAWLMSEEIAPTR